jgi:uncharacterized protein YecT (DUF1311 family)
MFNVKKIILLFILTPFIGSASDLIQDTIRYDKQLNIAYKAAIKQLNKTQILKLRKAQRLWIKYRNAICEFERDLSNKEHWIEKDISNAKSLECISRLSKARTIELRKYSQLANGAQKETNQNEINIDRSIIKNENALEGWIFYGISLKVWPIELNQNGKPNLYKREVFARSKTATVWQELREKKAVNQDNDLDSLVSINEAGFMREYVWLYINNNSKNIPKNLRLNTFKQWMSIYLPEHKAIVNTGVTVPI